MNAHFTSDSREHFHCLECHRKIFIKKEEMIRHFKWHKKRDESLQHGFMRYSPGDDCGDRYHNCQHNRKQTHYHCIQVSRLCNMYHNDRTEQDLCLYSEIWFGFCLFDWLICSSICLEHMNKIPGQNYLLKLMSQGSKSPKLRFEMSSSFFYPTFITDLMKSVK